MDAPQPAADAYEGTPIIEQRTLRGVRRVIARRLGGTWRAAVPATLHSELGVSALVASAVGAGSGPLDLLLRAVVQSLEACPVFNATFDGEVHRLYGEVHLSLAVDTPKGLVVPILRQAHSLSLADLATACRELAARVQAWQHDPNELVGGTFTVSNLGPLGIDFFTPIINPPQVAILGVGRLRCHAVGWRPERCPRARWTWPLSCTFDHRLADGADAARFLQALQVRLSDPVALRGQKAPA